MHQYLNTIELEEVRQYDRVHYFNHKAQRVLPDASRVNNNTGYDTDSGVYKCFKHDHIAYRYELLSSLGHGSFGDVMHARDHKTKQDVAIKILVTRKKQRNPSLADQEVKILSRLSGRRTGSTSPSNVVAMLDHFTFRNHLCIVFEKLDHGDLEQLMEQEEACMSESQLRQLTTSMLQCVQEVHNKGVIHCDIKPENFLLASADGNAVKIIDFGLSSLVSARAHSYGFGSLFYNAPEVNLDAGYGMQIDIWSVGCIVAEMCLGEPLFGGESEAEHIALLHKTLGMPSSNLLSVSRRSSLFFRNDRMGWAPIDASHAKPGSRPLSTILAGKASSAAIDFIQRCLQWDPVMRMTTTQALQHPFIAGDDDEVAKKILKGNPDSTSTISSLVDNLSIKTPSLAVSAPFSLQATPVPSEAASIMSDALRKKAMAAAAIRFKTTEV